MNNFFLQTDTTINIYLNATGFKKRSGNTFLRIYPNPSVDRIWIEGLPGGERNLHLIDPMGIIIREFEITGGRFSVDISYLEEGIYYLLDSEGGKAVMVIKQ